MKPRTFAITDSFATKGRGTVLIVTPDSSGAVPSVGEPVALHYPGGGVFRSTVKAVEPFMISPPRSSPPVGVMLADDPGTVPNGAKLHSAA